MKIKLLSQISIGLYKQYEVQVLDDGKKLWLRLSGTHFNQVLAFWSQKSENSESYEEVFTQLSEHLAQISLENGKFTKAIDFWPTGWDYWGSFLPQPIAWYFTSGEFQNQINLYNAERLFDEYFKQVDIQSDYGIGLKHISSLLLELSLPCQEKYGFATMLMLDYSNFIFPDGVIVGDKGISLSITEIGNITSLLFSVIGKEKDWWISQYNQVNLESYINKLAKNLLKRTQTTKLVKSVETFLL